jgi:hypothetical protein
MQAEIQKRCCCGRPVSRNKEACRGCLEAVCSGDGVLEILNVQGGDVKITFEQGNEIEAIRARRIVQDMLRRGYALVVEVKRGGKKAYERVKRFDPKRGEYIIADLDDKPAAVVSDVKPAAAELVASSPSPAAQVEHQAEPPDLGLKPRGRPLREQRLPMEKTRAMAIGPTAGG